MRKLIVFILGIFISVGAFAMPPDSSSIRKLPKAATLKDNDLFWISNRGEAVGAADSSIKASQIVDLVLKDTITFDTMYVNSTSGQVLVDYNNRMIGAPALIYDYATGKLGIGTSMTPQHFLAITTDNSATKSTYWMNLTNATINRNRATPAAATDTSSFWWWNTRYTGKPYGGLNSNVGTKVWFIDTTEYVAIGNVTPTSRLHIDGGVRECYLKMTASGTTGTDKYSGSDFGIDSTGINTRIMNWENGEVHLGVNGIVKLSINSSAAAFTGSFVAQSLTSTNGNITAAGSFAVQTNGAQSIGYITYRNATTSGSNLTVLAQSAKLGISNLNGGSLILRSGVSTGIGKSLVQIDRTTRAISGTADNTRTSALIIPSQKTLLNNAVDTLFSVSLPTLAMAGGNIEYIVTATNGTDMQTHSGHINYSSVNKAGVYTTQIVDELPTVEANAYSAGTLSETWSIITGTNIVYIACNFNSSLNPTAGNMKIYFTIHNGSTQTITPF